MLQILETLNYLRVRIMKTKKISTLTAQGQVKLGNGLKKSKNAYIIYANILFFLNKSIKNIYY